MLGKIFAIGLVIPLALWAAGVDFASVKDSVTGVASDNARAANGRGDDWG